MTTRNMRVTTAVKLYRTVVATLVADGAETALGAAEVGEVASIVRLEAIMAMRNDVLCLALVAVAARAEEVVDRF